MPKIKYDTSNLPVVSPRQRRHVVYMGLRLAAENLMLARRVIQETGDQEEYTANKLLLNRLLRDICESNGTEWFDDNARFDWESAIEQSIEDLTHEINALLREA